MNEFKGGVTRIPLMTQPYDEEEIAEAIDSLRSGRVTMGRKVAQFESMFAEYIGVKHAVMVNSGSSANLLAVAALFSPGVLGRLCPGDEIITPAVTWATTVFPIAQCGAVPVLVDVDLDTFNINIDEIEKAITEKTRAIMPVHLLGNPCYMDEILGIAAKYNLYVIEDACESHGAEINGRKTGSFSDISTFSFYYSHHITTIEGGMVLTESDSLAELVKSLRVFGWIRELDNRQHISAEYPDLDPRFLFINAGYCFRPTEIQGAFGIHQIKKLDGFINIRRDNAEMWRRRLEEYGEHLLLQREREGTKHVWFGYPITVKPGAPFTRDQLVDYLESKGVETRPVMTGNMEEQPAMKQIRHRVVGELPNASYISRNSFFFGNHQGIGTAERNAVADYIDDFMRDYA